MATEIEESSHYNGEVEINFYPNSHRYKLKGEKGYLIGVTTATGMVDKSRPLMIWAERLTQDYLNNVLATEEAIDHHHIEEAINQRNIRLEQAATTGTLVHEWAEAYIKGEDPEIPEDDSVSNGVLAFLKWVSEHDVKFAESEVRVYSKEHQYVGTMDTIFTMGHEGHKVLHAGDFKTGSGVYIDQAFQVSAYQAAYTEEHGTKFGSKWILRFVKEDKIDRNTGIVIQEAGTFEAKEFKAEEHEGHFKGFLGALEIKRQDKIWNKLHNKFYKR